MSSSFLVALATFFATVGVADIAFIFAGLTRDNSSHERFVFALRGIVIASVILLFFAFLGNQILDLFGITLPALRTAGGILLMLIAIDMVFARHHSGGTGTTDEEDAESKQKNDISVFPLALPLLAGPGTISAVILLTTGATSDFDYWMVIVALLAVLAMAFIALLMAIPLQRLLGRTGLAVVSRVIGILLAALAVQFIFDGVSGSALFNGAVS